MADAVYVGGRRMSEYHVAYMCVYSDVVEADSPEEAAKIVASECPYDIDGEAEVTRIDTYESWTI
jgi:hypothetical protein